VRGSPREWMGGWQIRQRMSLRGLCAAEVVLLHERHDACGAGWLDNMEQVQQHDHDQRDA